MTVRRPRPSPPARVAAVLAVALTALALALNGAPALAQSEQGQAGTPRPAVSEQEALRIAGAVPEIQGWIADHPIVRTAAELDEAEGEWVTYHVSAEAGAEDVEAQAFIDARTGTIREVRVGPQVDWSMARGYDGAFGRAITRPAVWLTLCGLFLVPLLRLRRLWSVRTLDLLVLLSFSVSLVWFNRGEIFTSVPLAYPPLLYLAARLAWIGLSRRGTRRRADSSAPTASAVSTDEPTASSPARPGFAGWCPTWLLVSALVVALLLRYGLNAFDSNVIDVGYAGVIGAERILDGETPYGTFPSDCGNCDTYGPLNYIAYTPFVATLGWSGEWDALPAAHGAATLFDVLCVLGMLVLGWQLGGPRLGALLALAWAAFPFTAYTLESNANDALVAAMLVWGIVLAAKPVYRGLFLGLAVATKFAPAALVLLWARSPYPARGGGPRALAAYVGGLAGAGALTAWVLVLDGLDGISAFWSRTIGYQVGRESPFSLWGQVDWLGPGQIGLTVLVGIGALALARWPRQLELRSWVALSGAVLVGVQLTLTHWFYLYIPWFLPFALLALVPEWPARRTEGSPPVAAGPEAATAAAAADSARVPVPA